MVQVPSIPLSFIVKFVLYLSCGKNENKQKEAEFGPFKKDVEFTKTQRLTGAKSIGDLYLVVVLTMRRCIRKGNE